MPPPMYKLTSNHPRRGRVRSAAYYNYRRVVEMWVGFKRQEVNLIQDWAANCKGQPLTIDATFWFQRADVFTKDGKIKKMDTANRLKALHDIVAEILNIDDSQFFSGSFKKRVLDNPNLGEYVTMAISLDQ